MRRAWRGPPVDDLSPYVTRSAFGGARKSIERSLFLPHREHSVQVVMVPFGSSSACSWAETAARGANGPEPISGLFA